MIKKTTTSIVIQDRRHSFIDYVDFNIIDKQRVLDWIMLTKDEIMRTHEFNLESNKVTYDKEVKLVMDTLDQLELAITHGEMDCEVEDE